MLERVWVPSHESWELVQLLLLSVKEESGESRAGGETRVAWERCQRACEERLRYERACCSGYEEQSVLGAAEGRGDATKEYEVSGEKQRRAGLSVFEPDSAALTTLRSRNDGNS